MLDNHVRKNGNQGDFSKVNKLIHLSVFTPSVTGPEYYTSFPSSQNLRCSA